MDVHQFATSLAYGDAISDEMLEIRAALRERGYGSDIFVRQFDPRMAGEVRDFREYRRLGDPRNAAIFHFSIGSPVSKLFARLPDRKIMIYHNITPAGAFVDFHRVLARECHKGRLEMRLFADKVDLAVGDSEFNRRELEAAGFRATGVLPILMNLDKFEGPGDPVTRDLYDNGKATLLFVGRFIPNKRFEDVLKIFHLYKRHFNPDSQLVLGGDYRGLERYFDSLRDLAARLGLTDVHFPGHAEFDELLALYRAADVYVSMSEHEGFGVPLLEAFRVGLPVLAYAAGAVEETLNGGGVLVRSKDFLRLAGLVDRLVSDEALRARVVEGQRRALAKYDRENVRRILFDLVDRAARG